MSKAKDIDLSDAGEVLKGVVIPPRPQLLLDIHEVYPDIQKIASLIETDQGVVLAKNSTWKDDVYSIITGFIDPNESPISAIKRECMEELGLAASSANLVGIYPFEKRNQIIMVYHVEAHGDIALNDELRSFKLF